MSPVGYSYFFNPQAPSFFLSGSLGLGVANYENADSDNGFGWGIGAGYEFATNWVIEASYLSAKVYDEGDFGLTASNLALTISWFAY
jgi:opacity protein-like surface antigen